MNRKTGNQHRCDAIARNAQCHHRNHGTAEGCIVRCFGCPNAFVTALSEFFRMLARLLRLSIGYHVGNAGAHARQEADPKADQEGANNGRKIYDNILQIDSESSEVGFLYLRKLALSLCIIHDDAAERKHTEHLTHCGKTGIKIMISEGIT